MYTYIYIYVYINIYTREPHHCGPQPAHKELEPYRGASLIRNRPTLGPYSRPTPRALWWS